MTEGVGKARILIVDDMPQNIRLLHDTLRDDYRTFFATNGEEALRTAAEVSPDLVLLDIMMPEMDGYEVFRRMKEDPLLKDIPVIFLTAMEQEEHETTGLQMGAVDYLTKPFNPSLITLRVKNQIELKVQRDMLAELANLDGLTGVKNRRAFDEYLRREWLRAVRYRHPVSLLMIDIDNFKCFNDHYGHVAGDDCLKTVAITMVKTIERPSDLLARYGGEEFACLLPETASDGALRVAHRMRENIVSLNIPHAYSDVSDVVTVSIGVATAFPCREMPPELLIKTADDQLYDAKRTGRNRVLGTEVGLPQ
ncbi:MAG: diguanylate cyclase [Nitrospirota bacterium]|nr:diguanylate cyclase [Nitrospirota bacterium]